MHIRIARSDEAGALAELACAAKAFWNYPPAQLEAWRETLSPTPASIAGRPTFVADVDGTLAAFCQLNPSATPVNLDHLWVHPRYIDQGLGRALLAHCLQRLAILGIEALHIDADPHAEAFYRRCGATWVGAIPAPIEGQPDRIRPQLRLAVRAGLCPSDASAQPPGPSS
ncbi:GNAT family N-acetyltransferase [Hydrogenophaga sp. PAMC20947]|uniref:GNAT family N-acetyltransferase n=1 Tax=Hydrogenophaga sp. PAMC20947 TaxID=2565558 RepID=UPI00109DBAAD|nr:GNAT family N-acetyltransferase [Hydrogenophaga sp. PAMC20947]QCB47593.1 N-acetyltransferase [Hydrogenophaga sp. PAMC20947]